MTSTRLTEAKSMKFGNEVVPVGCSKHTAHQMGGITLLVWSFPITAAGNLFQFQPNPPNNK